MNPLDQGILPGLAKPRASYAHARQAGDFIFVSGTSSRQADDSIAGAKLVDGKPALDIRAQTEAVLDNVERILRNFGAELHDVVEFTCFLVDMADYAGFNEVYNRRFDGMLPPTRTTVAVRQLPHPLLLLEIKAVAFRQTGAFSGVADR
jgi:2-aminomuconate deaminase